MTARGSRLWRRLLRWMFRRHAGLKSFEREVEAGGGMTARAEAGLREVPVDRIIGSVGRAQALGSDFFYRQGQKMTFRYRRIGALMQEGAALPPVHLYKLKRQRPDAGSAPISEYYVLDGHHRVAMARKLGQAYLDASVLEYQVADGQAAPADAPEGADSGDAPPPRDDTARKG